ncbi:amidohydrolase [Melioribacteraceae bacterium 4301-Me]|uniref:amidohydrolase n=1 Tax=Pyranulibacter aquaticus TaxID=3163344 RepID=UPI003594DF22
MKKIIYSIAIMILLTACGEKIMHKADLVLLNGKIVTMDDNNPEGEALAIKGDKILAVGSADEIKEYIGDSTNVIDLKGKFVMPGFIESHAHFMGLGEFKMNLDLTHAKNWDEVIAEVAKAAENSRPGEWILGRGWHQEKFDPKPEPSVEGYPVHNELSRAVPNNPVILEHASGHAVFANAKAMELAGINNSTLNPNGGRIVRDSLGNAIGVFEENAADLIYNVYQEYRNKKTPQQIRNERVKQIQLASQECLSKGITSFVDAGEPFEIIDLMKELVDSNKIPIRLYVMINDSLKYLKSRLKDYKIIGAGNYHLTVRSIKKYVDGALGSRGAWMLEPYSDLPNYFGSNVTPINELKQTAELAINNDFQVCIHAIGDRGNREVLNLYENIFNEHPNKKDLRWRIEHAQNVTPEDVPRFAKLGVIASMQTCHCTSDAVFVIERIGENRAKSEAYVWRKLINSGALICNGTDAPVEDVNPIPNFYSAVTRKTSDGKAFFPEEKMTRIEALKSYTINGAYASFEENIKGSLTPGKLADIVVLSNDLLNCPENEIQNTKVMYTIVGGKVLFSANDKQ